MMTRTALTLLALLALSPAHAETQKSPRMEVIRARSQPKTAAGPEHFTGQASSSWQFVRKDPARLMGALVSFERGARTDWHSHPLGQTLIVMSGVGWTQCGDSPVIEMRPGDVVWCPPGQKHWHGATLTSAMSHIALQESLDGKVVEWMDKVTDAQYRAGLAK